MDKFLVLPFFLLCSSCTLLPPIKIDPADVPICRALHERPQTQKVKDIGDVTVMRPNPVCMYGQPAQGNIPAIKGIGEAKCGYCFWTISDKHQLVGDEWNHLLPVRGKKKKWSTIIAEGGIIPAESQASLKEFSVNVCHAAPICGKEIDRWRVKIDAADSIAEGLKPR